MGTGAAAEVVGVENEKAGADVAGGGAVTLRFNGAVGCAKLNPVTGAGMVDAGAAAGPKLNPGAVDVVAGGGLDDGPKFSVGGAAAALDTAGAAVDTVGSVRDAAGSKGKRRGGSRLRLDRGCCARRRWSAESWKYVAGGTGGCTGRLGGAGWCGLKLKEKAGATEGAGAVSKPNTLLQSTNQSIKRINQTIKSINQSSQHRNHRAHWIQSNSQTKSAETRTQTTILENNIRTVQEQNQIKKFQIWTYPSALAHTL